MFIKQHIHLLGGYVWDEYQKDIYIYPNTSLSWFWDGRILCDFLSFPLSGFFPEVCALIMSPLKKKFLKKEKLNEM